VNKAIPPWRCPAVICSASGGSVEGHITIGSDGTEKPRGCGGKSHCARRTAGYFASVIRAKKGIHMKKRISKILSVIMALILCLGMLPAVAVAARDDCAHEWQNVATAPGNRAATCTETGVQVQRCLKCDGTQEISIPMVAHTPDTAVTEMAIKPTCTQTGLSAGSHCSVCKRILEEQEELPMLPHSWGDWIIDRQPVGDVDGKRHRTCSACHTSEEEIIPANPCLEDACSWEIVVTATKAATCTQAGVQGERCTACGADRETVIPPLGHSWDAGVVTKPPTETEEGIQTYTCIRENCGATRITSIPKLPGGSGGQDDCAHEWQNVVTATGNRAATCTETGVQVQRCLKCDGTQEISIPMVAHTPDTAVTEMAVKPTCTRTGLSAGSHCSVCKQILEEQEELPILPHSWGDWIIDRQPVGDVDGKRHRTCSACHASEEEIIPANPGPEDACSWEIVATATKAATCTQAGVQGERCTACGATRETVIPPLGHSWDEGIVTQPPTETEDGVKTFTCTRENCGATKTEAIPATGGAVNPPVDEEPEEPDPPEDEDPKPVPGPEDDPVPPNPGQQDPDEREEFDIPEDEVPLAPGQQGDGEELDIPDDEVPLAPGRQDEGEELDIPEDEVPLADVPKTGDASQVWEFMVLISGIGLVWLVLDYKRCRDAGM